MESRSLGLLIVAVAVVLLVVGVLLALGGLGWFGRLPGDLRIDRGNVRVHVPLVSMLLVSLLLSVLVAAVRRWL